MSERANTPLAAFSALVIIFMPPQEFHNNFSKCESNQRDRASSSWSYVIDSLLHDDDDEHCIIVARTKFEILISLFLDMMIFLIMKVGSPYWLARFFPNACLVAVEELFEYRDHVVRPI